MSGQRRLEAPRTLHESLMWRATAGSGLAPGPVHPVLHSFSRSVDILDSRGPPRERPPSMSSSETISQARRLAELTTELEHALDTGAVEAVHHLRVAAGRLSVWLELGGRRVLRDDLRWLRGSAARTRDIDVLLAEERPSAWRAHLTLEREAAMTATRARWTTTRTRALIAALSYLPALERGAAEAGLKGVAQRAWHGGEALSAHERDPERLHRARRRFRRLRYALEWLEGDASVAKSLQDAFGALNDACVERAAWDRLPAEPRALLNPTEARDLPRVLDARIETRRTEAFARWRDARAHVRGLARARGGA